MANRQLPNRQESAMPSMSSLHVTNSKTHQPAIDGDNALWRIQQKLRMDHSQPETCYSINIQQLCDTRSSKLTLHFMYFGIII